MEPTKEGKKESQGGRNKGLVPEEIKTEGETEEKKIKGRMDEARRTDDDG